jgi:hypothetical protein
MDIVHLNIGGSTFQTTFQTLAKIPDTKLSGLKQDISCKESPASFFFDRNPDVFNSILDLYRTGELHVPSNICGATLRTELDFWQIDQRYLSECCIEAFYKHESNLSILKEIKNLENNKVLDVPIEECREGCWRNCIWRTLQYPRSSIKASVSVFSDVTSEINSWKIYFLVQNSLKHSNHDKCSHLSITYSNFKKKSKSTGQRLTYLF